MGFVFAYDVTAQFYSKAPQGTQLCGYDTGSGGVAWTPQMWAAHPGAVHIDQAPYTSVLQAMLDDEDMFSVVGHVTSDVLDSEDGAVPVGSPLLSAWARGAQASFAAAVRPGQRRPALYQSLSNVSANVNALIAGGVTSGVGLWIASWGMPTAQAIAELAAASGPFPVIGLQVANAGDYDVDLFSAAWLSDVSGDGWVFGPLRNFRAWPGQTTFGVSFYSPGTPEPLGVSCYEIAVCEGQLTQPGAVIDRYPVYLPKGSTSQVQYTGHGLSANVLASDGYTIFGRAVATDGGHAGSWTRRFITAGS